MEDTLLLLARLALAAVFAVAGAAKLADQPGSRKAMQDFGVPAPAAGIAGLLLPIAEIAVAIFLLPVDTARWAAIGGLVLLLAFIGGIAYNLSKGRTPDCHCFGQIHSEPAGPSTLIRNGVLAAVAAAVIGFGWSDPGPSIVGWLGDLSTGETVALALTALLVVVAAIEGWLLVHLLSQNGRLLIRIDAMEEAITSGSGVPLQMPTPVAPAPPPIGLPVGSPAPAFSLTGLYGETMTLDALRARGKPVFLMSSDPTCGPCNALLPEIGKWQREYESQLTVAMISRGTVEANRSKVAEHGVSNVLLQQDREVAELYQAYGTPSGWVVQADGKIGSPIAQGRDAIRHLVARTVGAPAPDQPAAPPMIPVAAQPSGNGNGNAAPRPAPAPAAAVQVGDAAPAVVLPDLDGNSVSLASFQGDKTLMVFWNPGCGFCKRMVEDIKSWEANPPAGAPKLLLVSTGAVEANREHGFSSTMVLDQGFETGRQFGASGTPSAILIDASGKVASRVAVGSPGVLALANNEDPAKAAPPAPPAPKTPKIGEPAPAIKLKDVDGREVSLASSRGTKTLVLFWNPGCGFCARMLEDIKTWEAKPPKGAPKLLVVSTGSVDDNKAMGLRSPVLLDQGFSAGNAFGASGTPSAVLVDAKGNIASEIAVVTVPGSPRAAPRSSRCARWPPRHRPTRVPPGSRRAPPAGRSSCSRGVRRWKILGAS